MATINGTSGADIIGPGGVSAGVTGGVPSAADDIINSSGGSDTIDGGGGANTLNYAGLGAGMAATFGGTAYVGTVVKGSGTDTFSNIRAIYGSAFADTLTGTSDPGDGPYSIILRGGGGNDTIDGQNNYFNRLDYGDATGGVTVNLGTGTATGPSVGTDTLVNVVRVRGSAFADSVTGGSRSDLFQGSNGNDAYFGGGGGASLDYFNIGYTAVTVTAAAPDAGLFGYGNHSIVKAGGFGTDTASALNTIVGTSGNDVFTGLSSSVNYSWNAYNMRGVDGNDTYNFFGNSINRLDYSTLNAAVTVDLEAGTGIKGANGTDTLNGVRAVRATSFNDALSGSAEDDSFLVGALGAHTIDGRGGSDVYRYSGSSALTVDLQAGTAVKFNGVTDLLAGIEEANGGEADDVLRGDAGDNFLRGLAGSNLLDGRGGEDTASFSSFFSQVPTQGGTIDLRNQTALNPWGGTDTLISIEHAGGSAFADTLIGLVRTDGIRSFLRGGGGNDALKALDSNGNALTGTTVTADYFFAPTAVTLNLQAGLATDDGYFGGQDTLVGINSARGSAYADSLTGSDRNDVFEGGLGNDVIAGGGGRDVAVLAGTKAASTVTRAGSSVAVTGADGTDQLTGIETLRFADGDVQVGGSRPNDLTGRGFADILWREAGGSLYMFQQQGATIAAQTGFGALDNVWTLRGKGDFDGNGASDLLWRHADGTLYQWQLGGAGLVGQGSIASLSNDWAVSGVGDFNGDGRADIMFRHLDGTYYQWQMDGLAIIGQGGGFVDSVWQISRVADFNGDGKSDLLWRNGATGDHYMFLMDGVNVLGQGGVGNPGAEWNVAAVGDLNGDGRADLVWRNGVGDTWAWMMDGNLIGSAGYVTTLGPQWSIATAADFTGDGKDDLLWRLDTGDTWLTPMDGSTITQFAGVANVSTNWSIL